MLKADEIKFLADILPFWRELSQPEKELIAVNTHLQTFSKGEVVYQGECAGIILVKSGELRSFIISKDGREITLYRLFERDVCVLTASCIIKQITFDINLTAEKHSQVYIISPDAFEKVRKRNFHADRFVYEISADRFSDVMWAMEQILFFGLDQRLAVFLVDESHRQKSDTIRLTHEQIAKYLGSAREVVSRMLKYFENEGIIQLSRGAIKVINKRRLMELAA